MITVVVGLGNTGAEYEHTRHNFAWFVLEALAQRTGAGFKQKKCWLEASCLIGSKEILLIKPLTFMNRSGQVLKELVKQEKIDLEKILVICDDVELEFGRFRLRPSGGTGGHNGLKSIVELLDTQDFGRLRLGIGRGRGNLVDHVLSNFSREEQKQMPDLVDRACSAVEDLLSLSWQDVMAKYN